MCFFFFEHWFLANGFFFFDNWLMDFLILAVMNIRLDGNLFSK